MKKDSITITRLANSNSNSNDRASIVLEGQLIIRNMASLKSELIHALQAGQNIHIVLKNITKIDLAVLQVLIALQKSAEKLTKKISFDFEISDNIKAVIHHSGLEKFLIKNSNTQHNGIH